MLTNHCTLALNDATRPCCGIWIPTSVIRRRRRKTSGQLPIHSHLSVMVFGFLRPALNQKIWCPPADDGGCTSCKTGSGSFGSPAERKAAAPLPIAGWRHPSVVHHRRHVGICTGGGHPKISAVRLRKARPLRGPLFLPSVKPSSGGTLIQPWHAAPPLCLYYVRQTCRLYCDFSSSTDDLEFTAQCLLPCRGNFYQALHVSSA